MATPKQFTVGDRVVVNERNATHQGKKGTVKYISGGQRWVKFDEEDQLVPGMGSWWLDPVD